MSKYNDTTIKQIIKGIYSNEYLLPVIQREMVWEAKQIEDLFDSLMSDFPIGTMLFWNYRNNENYSYKFYEFLKVYDEYNASNNHNKEVCLSINSNTIGVLDGQQRLTALYLGLNGYINVKIPRKKHNNADNFEKKYLYVNVLYENNNTQTGNLYDFKFLTEEDYLNKNESNEEFWFKIGEILNFEKASDYRTKFRDKLQELTEAQMDKVVDFFTMAFAKFNSIQEICYYEESDPSLDKILKIFVRVNSGGTALSYTDFLMSLIVSQWGEGRAEINDRRDEINNDFKFTIPKDIFLRACLFLSNLSLDFKADNFKNDSINKIKSEFNDIIKYLRASCDIFQKLGYSKDNLKSNLIFLPLALFLKNNKIEKLSESEFQKIKKWIQVSILAKAFNSHTTSYLIKLRNTINNKTEFPLDAIIDESNKFGRQMNFSDEMIMDIIESSKYSTQDSWTILTLLYPNNNYALTNFHEDHIYPISKLSKEEKSEGGNYLPNLQLLEGYTNQSKSDKEPDAWIKEFCHNDEESINKYKKKNFIPDFDLSKENFEKYIMYRKNKILEELKKVLEQ